jgi:3-oxoadipate enol-lactonase
MPFAELKDTRIYYQLEGPETAPVLVFSNSLGTDVSLWDGQAAAMVKTFRVLRYDKRGHGRSSSPAGPYSIATLGGDVIGLLDFLHLDKVNFCGLSIGGQTGMWLGGNAGARLHKLILCNTAAKIGNVEWWNDRIASVRRIGMKGVAPGVIERWFTERFRTQQLAPPEVAEIQRVLEGLDIEGYLACAAAVRDFDFREKLGGIRVPTLVISGTHDPAATAADGRWAAEQIPGAKYVELDAAHLSNIEQRERFTTEISSFLAA